MPRLIDWAIATELDMQDHTQHTPPSNDSESTDKNLKRKFLERGTSTGPPDSAEEAPEPLKRPRDDTTTDPNPREAKRPSPPPPEHPKSPKASKKSAPGPKVVSQLHTYTRFDISLSMIVLNIGRIHGLRIEQLTLFISQREEFIQFQNLVSINTASIPFLITDA
jgi:hypothetical protein